jgi:hypothetical protein
MGLNGHGGTQFSVSHEKTHDERLPSLESFQRDLSSQGQVVVADAVLVTQEIDSIELRNVISGGVEVCSTPPEAYELVSVWVRSIPLHIDPADLMTVRILSSRDLRRRWKEQRERQINYFRDCLKQGEGVALRLKSKHLVLECRYYGKGMIKSEEQWYGSFWQLICNHYDPTSQNVSHWTYLYWTQHRCWEADPSITLADILPPKQRGKKRN